MLDFKIDVLNINFCNKRLFGVNGINGKSNSIRLHIYLMLQYRVPKHLNRENCEAGI